MASTSWRPRAPYAHTPLQHVEARTGIAHKHHVLHMSTDPQAVALHRPRGSVKARLWSSGISLPISGLIMVHRVPSSHALPKVSRPRTPAVASRK